MSEIITEPVDVEFLEKERDYLLSQETISDEDVVYLFGSMREYLRSLMIYSHPQHNEAMTIRNKRCIPRAIDPDQEKKVEHTHEWRLQNVTE
jgi:hypothetical protein